MPQPHAQAASRAYRRLGPAATSGPLTEPRMANNSATGGYLLPLQASPPLEDAELEAVFQGYIAGVSGLPSNLVRTRWPAAGAEPPAPDQTWCLMDIRSQAADAAPAVTHDPAGEGLIPLFGTRASKCCAR